RIALVCYGGISLAVYMHGVTKELWKLGRASRNFHADKAAKPGSQEVYRRLLEHVESNFGLRLRVLTDIVAGASAGGINGVFLAQAIHSGQSLEPLTKLWLERADVDVLLDPDARIWTRFAKFWAVPIVGWLLRRPGNVISQSVAPGTRQEVRGKLSRLVRSRWFEAPFGGLGFSRLLVEALDAMAESEAGLPLLPQGHPLDLFVTTTDFKGHAEVVRLHSPALVEESEHRVSIGFRSEVPGVPGLGLADSYELVFAARATASFPGAFPALRLAEIDRLVAERNGEWSGREAFVARLFPEHARRGETDDVSLIDGSVLVNAPFADAMSVLRDRPAQREIDRRFVYIDPKPDEVGGMEHSDTKQPGWFSVIFGSLSSIPREQPVRDNLDALAQQSRSMQTLRRIVASLRPDIEAAVDKLFGRTLFLDRPTMPRLTDWRSKAQTAAAKRAGYAFDGYAQIKLAGIISDLARIIHEGARELDGPDLEIIERILGGHVRLHGLGVLSSRRGGASPEAIAFFRDHDLQHRIRRLRLIANRLTQDWDGDPTVGAEDRERARDAVYRALAVYFAREKRDCLGPEFAQLAASVGSTPGTVLDHIAACRDLKKADFEADTILADALALMPKPLRRQVLLAYLGFPFYDTVTLPLLRNEGLGEFDPVKVDRISPEDCVSIRKGGAAACLRGVEFYNFGAFFSRSYRENDYLWGRLHGAERMMDMISSSMPDGQSIDATDLARFKSEAFLAILDEEEERLVADPGLVPGIRAEVLGAT
ncbi:MAG: patatin-like protein, partial [Novosphingobium sp.]